MERRDEVEITFEFVLKRSEDGKTHVTVEGGASPTPTRTGLENIPSIAFTGFKAADRTRLEALATKHGLMVSKSIPHGLKFIVGGYNAGPSKIENAKSEGAMVLSEEQFLKLLSTGELPLQ